jgi:hypothetical protein
MNNQISYLNKISYNKRNELAYLQIGAQELEVMPTSISITKVIVVLVIFATPLSLLILNYGLYG